MVLHPQKLTLFDRCTVFELARVENRNKSSHENLHDLNLWFANITIAVYGALSEIIDHGFGFSFKEMGLVVDAAYCSTYSEIIIIARSVPQVAAGVQDTLLSIDILNVDRPTQNEIDHFIQAIEMNPAVVSLKGYADVNRELLTSALSTIAIYLIVLLQFKISLPKEPQGA
ncbi:Gustatory and odorant receptor 22 [Eumeta japonica]|uniref:Gustatory and odorant receptor 22 n=1 Tax=Eumeta variegata TaxID=151549 RepID=A0A4C1U7J6_EUMVA|nr:Gustatory and odorant receptor 22 [Eumeta japonica]